MKSEDWTATPFGARAHWSPRLATMVDFLTASDVPMTLYWGPEQRVIFNEAAIPGFGDRPAAIGATAAEIWGDWWPQIEAQFSEIARTGRSLTLLDVPFAEPDGSRIREIYWNLTFWSVPGEDGALAGILCAARETTDEAFQKRLDRLLVDLDDALLHADTVDAMIDAALALIAEQLRADRVGFGEVDQPASQVAIRRLWTTADMPDIRGRYPLGHFGAISSALGDGQTTVIDDSETDPRTADPVVRQRYRWANMRSGLVVPIRENGEYAGGIFVQSPVPRTWTPFEIRIAEAATARLWNALQRMRTEIALRASEQRYRLIFEQAEDIIFTADIDQRITDTNAAGARAMGMSREAIVGRSIADFVSPEGYRQTTEKLGHKLRHGGNTRHEISVTGKDGRQMLWDNNSTLIFDRDNTPIGLLSISRDVTERRAYEERRELLINELNHRVKNTLALVQAIALQTFPAGSAGAERREEFIGRLRTLAGAHDLLTREDWEGVTLADIVRWGTTAIDGREDRIVAGGPPLKLTPKAGVALAMAFHELATNAVKYGALSVAEGRIDLAWQHTGERIAIDWRERGGPPVVPPRHRGFGSRMIERVLASDLGGRVTMDFAREGLHCAVDAPAEGNLA